MGRKKFPFIIVMVSILFTMDNGLQAGHKNKDKEECGFSTLIRKCLSCFKGKQKFDDADEEYLLEQGDTSFVPGIRAEKNIPLEMLWQICYELSPLDIIQVSLTCQNIRDKITENFWKSYLQLYNQKSWDPSFPAIKIAVAFSLFKQGKIKQAATLGFPKAVEIMRKKENEKEEEKWRGSPYPPVRYELPLYKRNRYTYPIQLKMRNGFQGY